MEDREEDEVSIIAQTMASSSPGAAYQLSGDLGDGSLPLDATIITFDRSAAA